MRRAIASLLLLSAVTFAGGCASSGSSTSASGASGQRARSGAITAEQARETGASNAYDVVQALRPVWLRVRGTQSVNQDTGIAVYLDNTRLGGVDALRQINTANIGTIQYFDPGAAQARWGQGHSQGVILVTAAK